MTEILSEWLEEWRRWTLGETGPDFPICISAEHKYLSPQCWDEPEPRMPPLKEWMGVRVERVVSRLSEPFRTALRVDVCTVRQPWETVESFYERKRRLARLPSWQYHTVVDDSKKSVAIALGICNHTRGASLALKKREPA